MTRVFWNIWPGGNVQILERHSEPTHFTHAAMQLRALARSRGYRCKPLDLYLVMKNAERTASNNAPQLKVKTTALGKKLAVVCSLWQWALAGNFCYFLFTTFGGGESYCKYTERPVNQQIPLATYRSLFADYPTVADTIENTKREPPTAVANGGAALSLGGDRHSKVGTVGKSIRRRQGVASAQQFSHKFPDAYTMDYRCLHPAPTRSSPTTCKPAQQAAMQQFPRSSNALPPSEPGRKKAFMPHHQFATRLRVVLSLLVLALLPAVGVQAQSGTTVD